MRALLAGCAFLVLGTAVAEAQPYGYGYPPPPPGYGFGFHHPHFGGYGYGPPRRCYWVRDYYGPHRVCRRVW